MPGTILEKIVETKRREVADAKATRPLDAQREAALAAEPPRDFYSAVTRRGQINLIAEIKQKSPSGGVLREPFDPMEIAAIYEQNDAAALSVLTDRVYFGGDLSFIDAVRRATGLPVLRKDFVVDEYQVYESRAAGADAILLISEVLTGEQLRVFSGVASELGMATLIELHDATHLADALPLISADRRIILGINNRDLHAQRTDVHVCLEMAGRLPTDMGFVAESGIRTREDVQRLQDAGACAILVGETFMRAEDIGAKVRELMGR